MEVGGKVKTNIFWNWKENNVKEKEKKKKWKLKCVFI